MKFSLREEDTTSYILFYQEYLEEVQRLNRKVTDELNDVMQESKYDKLQNRISRIIDIYMETIVAKIEDGLFSSWVDSNGSLRACISTYRAGEAAEEVCVQIQHNMAELMQDILRIEKAEVIITERPIVSENDMDRLENACRNAQTEIQNIKSDFILQANTRSDENEIFNTLKPLFEGVASALEAFFETSLSSFSELHEFVREISLQLHNIAEEQGVASSVNKGINKKMAEHLAVMESASDTVFIDRFKEVTLKVYHLICNDVSSEKKELPYDVISKIMPIYHKFYSEYGEILKDRFENPEEKQEFIKREYIVTTRERNNEQFFEKDEVWTFKSHAYHTYKVFDRVADMEKNIANACEAGEANDINLMYGAYVLFMPIIKGHINSEDNKNYRKFSKWASEEILGLLDVEYSAEDNHQIDQDTDIDFEGENFSDENIKLFVVVVERIVNQVGTEELNSSVKKHYGALNNSRKVCSRKTAKRSTTTHNIVENTYGRYTVTKKSIRAMASVCNEVNSILEPIDKFYKEKFETLDKGFEKVNTIIHAISSFCGLWGLGTWNLSKMFSATDSDTTILEKVQLGGIALASCTTAGKLVNGGAHMLKIMDWALPYLKKSKTLVKLNEKIWNLTRQDIQIPYVQRMLDQYVMEHYEMEYGMRRGQSPYFPYYHSVTISLEDHHQRRAFENSIFAAETFLMLQHYTVNETNLQKNREIWCGIFLNLVRSGMCSEQDMGCRTANDIVDKLYNIYISKEHIKPRVDISPDKRAIE